MKKAKIVVIDSGIENTHTIFKNKGVNGIHVGLENGNFKTDFDIADKHGHGTAISGILTRYVDPEEMFIIKIYEEKLEADINVLLYALNYIKENIPPTIIHMSLGVRVYDKRLEDICFLLSQKGYLIIAAYDNEGAISFPAAFDCVVGVDISYECTQVNKYIYIENSIINVLAKGGYHRIPWIENGYILNQGTSFSAAYISGQVAKWLSPPFSFTKALEMLKENAMKIYHGNYSEFVPKQKIPFDIKKAAIIPYNKEIHSILNFEDMLGFEVIGYYDILKRTPSNAFATSINSNKTVEIKSYHQIDWDAFDTLIIGHLEEIGVYIHRDIKKELLDQCLQKRKNAFCFDNLLVEEYEEKFKKNGIKIYTPIKDQSAILKKAGKLYPISCPVLGVWGTSTSQGKFTLQLYLRKLFMDQGYNIGQIGTEPSSLLFGMDDSFPFGYNSNVNIDDKNLIESINSSLFYIDREGKDIILTGSQSGTVPMLYNQIEQLHLTQLEFLLGTNPDVVILCVNLFDDIDYIRRTISTIESLVDCTVLSIVVSPLVYPNDWQILSTHKVSAQENEIKAFKTKVAETTKKHVYTLGMMNEMEQLFQECINFLS